MSIRITFEVLGEAQIDRELVRFSEAITDARPLWNKLAAEFGRIESQQFAGQGTFSGGWQPLSPRYAAWKSRHYPGQPLLVRTGRLRRSLTQRPYGIERITGDSLTVGTDVPYAIYHQHGGSRLPQRRPVELTEAHRRDWIKTIQRYAVSGKV